MVKNPKKRGQTSIISEIKGEIRSIFESTKYCGHKLTNEEIEEMANNLTNFMEVILDYSKSKNFVR